jgi:hypothetical protein
MTNSNYRRYIKTNKRCNPLLVCLLVLAAVLITGCSVKEDGRQNDVISAVDTNLLFQQTVSPNKDYAESEDEIVYYTVEIYQKEDNSVVVSADSNAVFFDKMQYVLELDKKISETDIDVKWTTITGNPEPAKDDQLAVAQVTVYQNGEVMSRRKINFFQKGIEIITEVSGI